MMINFFKWLFRVNDPKVFTSQELKNKIKISWVSLIVEIAMFSGFIIYLLVTIKWNLWFVTLICIVFIFCLLVFIIKRELRVIAEEKKEYQIALKREEEERKKRMPWWKGAKTNSDNSLPDAADTPEVEKQNEENNLTGEKDEN